MSRPLPSLNALRAFESAARLGSLSAAANELHVTHGAISRHIRALEEELDCALFQRQGRGLSLTENGRRLRDTTAAAFTQLRDGCDQVRVDVIGAPVVLGCPVSLLARWMIPRLERLIAELPQLTLHLRPQETPLDEAMTGLDAALVALEPPWPSSWQVWPLARERVGPITSPAYAKTHRLHRDDCSPLSALPLLHTLSRPQAWPAWLSAMQIDPLTLALGPAYPHLYHVIEAAVAGLGIAIAPEQMVANDIANGRLIAPWGFETTAAQWALVAPARASNVRLVPLAAWLEQAFAG